MKKSAVVMQGRPVWHLEELPSKLEEGIPASELVYYNKRTLGSGRLFLLVYEKYYIRNGSYASLTILLTEENGIQTAEIIPSGGGEGLLNLDRGSNSSFAGDAERVLTACGLSRIS